MLPYILTFLGVALFPLALAAYGGHLATETLSDPKKRVRALLIVWGLAVGGVIAVALQQISSYQADMQHDKQQDALKEKLDANLLAQARMGGQLDSIGLMIGKLGEKTNDPELGQLAKAVDAIAKGVPSKPIPKEQPSTAELKNSATTIEAKLGYLRLDWTGADTYTRQKHPEVLENYQREFIRIRGDALKLRDKILQQIPRNEDDDKASGIFTGQPDVNSVGPLEAYMNSLISRLNTEHK